MKKVLSLVFTVLFLGSLYAQELKVLDPPVEQNTVVNSQVRIPLKIQNTTDHAVTFVISTREEQLGSGQRSWICSGDDCTSGPRAKMAQLTLNAGESTDNLSLWLETGAVKRFSSVKYQVLNQETKEKIDFEVKYTVEESSDDYMFTSPDIRVGTAYPNPVTEMAFIDYEMINEDKDVKILLHNVLGSKIGEFPLNKFENKLKISAQDLNPGVYFYTLYLDNEAIATKKLIVKK